MAALKPVLYFVHHFLVLLLLVNLKYLIGKADAINRRAFRYEVPRLFA